MSVNRDVAKKGLQTSNTHVCITKNKVEFSDI